MITVTIEKMNPSVGNPFFTTREFTDLIAAIPFVQEVCNKYQLDNFDFGTWVAGGIGYDYRLTIA